MNETLAFHKLKPAEWKTETTHSQQVATSFMRKQSSQPIEQHPVKKVLGENKVGDVVNNIFTNLAEVEGK